MEKYIVMRRLTNILLIALAVLSIGCSKRELNTRVSNTTGWNYFDQKTTNFEAIEGLGNVNPAGMVAIQGGTFTKGENDEFITAPRDNIRRTLTVTSFYMDKYEVTNLNWREYEHWMSVVFGRVAPELVARMLPDSTVWREEMAYNEPYELYYYRHPAFSFYPVVGVSWTQCMDYCRWRTDRVNELALMQSGNITPPPFDELEPTFEDATRNAWEEAHPGYYMEETEVTDPEDPTTTATLYTVPFDWLRDQFIFNTEKYLYDSRYNPDFGRHPKTDIYGNDRKINRADGILVVGYRLPTEAEWEFAAFAPVAGEDGLTVEGKLYPWSGYHPRNLKDKKLLGQMQANFVRGRGDMMGVSGELNDHYVVTGPVDEYQPNDFGLYNMAGNVNEWVMDVYRETTNQETSEYNSFRGNIYSKPVMSTDEMGNEVVVIDSLGRLLTRWESDDDKRDWKDGDFASIIDTDFPLDTTDLKTLLGEDVEIHIDPTDLLAPRITKNTRVYKGGSWKDRVYWINPSSRRYLEQDKSTATIGFRCAMSTVGNQIPNGSPTLQQ